MSFMPKNTTNNLIDKMIDSSQSPMSNQFVHQSMTLKEPSQYIDCIINDVNQVDCNSELISPSSSRYINRISPFCQQTTTNNYNQTLKSRCTNYNVKLSNDYMNSMNKFQYILMAPTSPAVKINEDTLTYLNQGQNYELKLSCLESASMENSINNYNHMVEDIKPLIHLDSKGLNENRHYLLNEASTLNQIVSRDANENDLQEKQNADNVDSVNNNSMLNSSYVYLSVIRLCFWDRKLQEIEHEEIKEVDFR